MSVSEIPLKPLPDHSLQLLHLGDSYTAAEGIAAAHGWPSRLRKALEAAGQPIAHQQVIAHTGWTTGDLLGAVRSARLVPQWDLITLCIGVNNQYRGLSLKGFELELLELTEIAAGNLRDGEGQLLLLSIPDWSVSPFASGKDTTRTPEEIDAFNQVILKQAKQGGHGFFDCTGLSRTFDDPADFAADGLHPSENQHAAWADRLAAFLQES